MKSHPVHRPRPLPSLVVILFSLGTLGHAAPLPRSHPEAQGVSSAGILAFVDEADRRIDSLHSFMLVRHGHVVAEGWWTPYGPDHPHELYSLSKSFTSTAVGIAVGEGHLSVDDEVLKFFPAEAPADPSANLKSMRVRDLLRMATGHQDEPPVWGDAMTVRSFLSQPVPHKPGSHFKYNTPATYLLAAIVEKVTGTNLVRYLTPRLFDPLGIAHPTWGLSSEGITLGGYGLEVRTEDIARFGQLYLQKGRWNGRQLVSEAWVAAATGLQVANGSNPKSDWDQGYGYQFWRCRHDAYRGDGAFGQYCIVLPEQDAVIAITGGVRDMQAVLDLVWGRLLPSLYARRLPADSKARRQLADRLARLSLPTVKGAPSSPTVARIGGRRFTFPANDPKIDALALEPGTHGTGPTLVLKIAGAENRIPCPVDEWSRGTVTGENGTSVPTAACGAWTSDDTFTAKLCAYETPFIRTLTLRFAGDEVFLDIEQNVGFGATQSPRMTGRLAESR